MKESKKVENSNKGVASANPGDIIIRSDGSKVELTQADIDWAKQKLQQEAATESSTPSVEQPKTSSNSTTRTSPPSSQAPTTSNQTSETTDDGSVSTPETNEVKNETKDQNAVVEDDKKHNNFISINYIASSPKNNKKFNLWKEFSDIISEIRIGLVNKASISLPNIAQCELELNVVSNEYKKNKDGSYQTSITSGIGFSYQIGPDNCPFVSNSIKYSKNSPDVGNAFSLFETDYVLSNEFIVNSDYIVTIPTPFVNVSLNILEGLDFFNKATNYILNK